jgi:hypothetical protein
MASWYIRHSIAVAAMVADLGSTLESVLHPETLELLDSLVPDGGWLETVDALRKHDDRDSDPDENH